MKSLTKDKYLDQQQQEDLQKLLSFLKPRAVRDVLIVEVALETGAREEEITLLEAPDIDQRNCSVFISKAGKGSDKREVPVSRELMNDLTAYIKSQGITGRLFPISTARIRQIWGELRPWPNRKFHSLRHTFARNVRSKIKGKREDITLKDLEILQYLLGHVSIENTMIYAREDLEVSHIRKVLGYEATSSKYAG